MPTPNSRQLAQILAVRGPISVRLRSAKAKVPWFRHQLLDWYFRNGRKFPWRRPGCNHYQLLTSELLLWRTRAGSVANFLPEFWARYPSWESINKTSESKLKLLLGPVGYVTRAGTLISLARVLVRQKLPSTRNELQALPGVGQYIASAVMAGCFGAREPLLDVNMARVLSRVFGPGFMADLRVDPYLQQLSRLILSEGPVMNLNWAILDLGALICKSRLPHCPACPLKSRCLYAKNNQTSKPSTT